MTVDPFTAACPLFQSASSRGNRHVPLARSTNWLSILKVFAVFAFGAFVLGFVCVFGWAAL